MKLKVKINYIIVGIIASSLFLLYFQFTIDDAYRTFRHSLNLVNHGILSWNIEGTREEAFTNPLFVGLGSIGIFAGLKPELPIKIINIFVIFIWIKRAIYLYGNSTKNNNLLIASIILLSPLTYIHGLSGFETFIFAYLIFEYLNLETIKDSKSILISSLLLLCRPEGILFLFTSIAYKIISLFKGEVIKLKKSDLIAYITLTLVSLFYIYKFYYFGDLLPNSYYVKSASNAPFLHVIFQIRTLLPWLIVAFFVTKKPIHGERILKIGLILFVTFYYSRSVLMQNYAGRYWYQFYFPLIFHEICTNEFEIFDKLAFNIKEIFNRPVFTIKRILLSSLFIFSFLFSVFHIKSIYNPYYSRYGKIVLSHAYGGKTLNKIIPKNETIMVGDAGLIPFYTDRNAFDSIGLGTKEIAKSRIVKFNFLKKNKPGVIILYAKNCTIDGTLDWGQSETTDYINKNNYKFMGGWVASDELCLTIFSREDLISYFDNDIFKNHMKRTLDNYNQHKNFIELMKEVFEEIKFSYKFLLSPLESYDLKK